jgi:hypothetical protein
MAKSTKALFAAVIIAGVSSCGYDGSYRYECQDPANWKEDYCNPPICLVDGMCTENLLGFDPYEIEKEQDKTKTTTLETVELIDPEENE